MLDFEVARARILEQAKPLASELVPTADADGRVLSQDLISEVDLPPFDYSAMDGYAVRRADLEGVGPWKLPVSTEQRAGDSGQRLAAGSAARIFTGAPLLEGSDSIIMQEDAERAGDLVTFHRAPPLGNHVRKRGEDLARGTVALSRGTRLNPFRIGLAAALDRAEVPVFKRPRVLLLCTGDELRDAGSAPRPGSIPDSNGPSLAALARRAGADVRVLPRTGDDLAATRAVLSRALAECDVLLTVGGVSVGDHDVVKSALEAEGVRIDFWKVKIKPGKPLAFGRRGDTWVLGLPGNPVSAQLTLCLFGLPLLRTLQGDASAIPVAIPVTLGAALSQKPGRLGFYRARLVEGVAHVHGNQASGAPTSMAQADVLVSLPAESDGAQAGATVSALRLDDL
ncbi:MAG: Molybdopterin biosynthesis protein MoeA [Polyangiaceae bacterium]|jgi:molybdopterin molybdotransferase|nr:Molybdopterin biosynthesis protein MoeA [Polyangiaceae bacterium]